MRGKVRYRAEVVVVATIKSKRRKKPSNSVLAGELADGELADNLSLRLPDKRLLESNSLFM